MTSPAVQPVLHRARIAPGPLRLEARLLADLEPLLSEREVGDLALPIRIAVPSRSLHQHLARRLARHFRALAGVRVQTLHALAVEIVERGAAVPPGDLLFPVAVRDCARAEGALRARLDALVDGYAVVEASVSDLLDAGFDPAHGEALAEALRAATGEGEGRARGLALARVAARVVETLERWGVAHRSRLLRAAREALEADPARALPARAVFLYGFADATAVQADLLDALLRHRGARIFLDRPPDPADPARSDPGAVFGERFARRIAGVVPGFDEPEASPQPPRIEVLHAPGIEAEVRGVADRVRALLDAGALPEEVGVVARQPGPYRVAVRRHFRRLGIPFSGLGAAGPAGPAGRRIEALRALLRWRERVPAELWLDALEGLPDPAPRLSPLHRADLLLGLHVLGAARLADVASLAARDGDVELPVRRGLGEAQAGQRRAPRRRLPRAHLAAATSAAASLVAHFAAWPSRDRLAAHLERLRALVHAHLRWSPSSPGTAELQTALFEAGGALRGTIGLDRDGLGLLVERCLDGVGDEPLGGRGAGVQVLDVMEARERTFEHLFVVGLSRDSFPRVIVEDPLLEDRVRRRLRDVLEDLPVKHEGHDEERFLFAQLLAAAPHVSLSAPICDEDGRARPVSPLLDGLRWAPDVPDPVQLPALYGPGRPERVRPAHEHALLAGLHAPRSAFECVLARAFHESALEDAGAGGGAGEHARGALAQARALARARCAVLAEVDPGLQASRRLGPYYGFVGPPGSGDPRGSDLYVTTVEQIARCPWRAFLERLLRVESLPDPHAELPSADPASTALLLGRLVHRVLERIVQDALGDGEQRPVLEEVLRRSPRPVPWPGPDELDARVARCAEELAYEEGIGLPGYPRLLALLARGPLAQARELDWPDGHGGLAALGAEVEGRLSLPGQRALHFLADRVDSDGGRLRLVDYKTGKPIADQKKDATRRAHFRDGVARGRLLQALAYARAAAACGAEAEGRYVYLKPDGGFPQRVFAARADDAELAEAFDRAVGAALGAFEQGSFVPRLIEGTSDEEHHSCERCAVKEACLRGDSGARRRLAEWVRVQEDTDPTGLDAAERALLAVWRLGGAAS
jgi:RecB family exonuclease